MNRFSLYEGFISHSQRDSSIHFGYHSRNYLAFSFESSLVSNVVISIAKDSCFDSRYMQVVEGFFKQFCLVVDPCISVSSPLILADISISNESMHAIR